jgi:hypothetical protein
MTYDRSSKTCRPCKRNIQPDGSCKEDCPVGFEIAKHDLGKGFYFTCEAPKGCLVEDC